MDTTENYRRLSATSLMLVLSAILPTGCCKNCYVCDSGDQSSPNRNCPTHGITAPYLVNSEACYGRCFIRANIHNPNVIFRGCTDLHPNLPTGLSSESCRNYSNELWCFCAPNLCNRASIDELRNPPEEEIEEEVEEEVDIQRLPHQVALIPNSNRPVPAGRGSLVTPSTNRMRPQWHLKRIPPELSDHKSLAGSPEAYLDVNVSNSSTNISALNEILREQDETTQDSNIQGSSTESISEQLLPSLLLCSTILWHFTSMAFTS